MHMHIVEFILPAERRCFALELAPKRRSLRQLGMLTRLTGMPC